MRTHRLVCLVAVLGCKKQPAAPGVEAPAAPASTAEQDALWQLAPDGAQIGVVGSPRGLAMIERGAVAITIVAPLGIVAGVAVPAFMDYMKRSKQTEATLQLDKN